MVIRVSRLAMARFLWGILVSSVIWSVAAGAASAAPPAPVAVISAASYDRWYDNVALIGALSGSPDLAQGLQSMLKLATGNRGLAGLDRTRPWAGIVLPPTAGQSGLVDAYACLPVDDLPALVDALRPLVGRVDSWIAREDEWYTLNVRDRLQLAAVPKGRWAMVARDAQTANHRSVGDPTPWLGDLPERYDLAARVFVPRLFEIERLGLGQSLGRAFVADLDELKYATVGAALDHRRRQLSAELILAAKAETPTARRWAGYERKKTCPLGAFRLPGAAIEGTWSGTLTERDAMTLVFLADLGKAKSLAASNGSNRQDPTARATGQVVADAFDLLRSLCAGRRMEGALSVVLAPQSTAGVLAVRLPARGPEREKIARLASLARYASGAETRVESDLDRQGEVSIRVVSIPLAEGERHAETLRRMFGDTLDVAVGLGGEHLYAAFGHGAAQSLREALAAMRIGTPAVTAPVELSVATGPVAQLAVALSDEANKSEAATIAAALGRAPGKDHLRVTAGPVDEGLRVRIEVEEGILGAASLAAAAVADAPSQAEP